MHSSSLLAGNGKPGATSDVDTNPKSPGPVLMKRSQTFENGLPLSPRPPIQPAMSSTKRGERTTNIVPTSAPAVVPAPPISRIAMNSIDSTRSHVSGGSLPMYDANSAPARPADADDPANAISLYLNSGIPITSAATSRSRIACKARPVRVRITFLAMTVASASSTRQKRYVLASPLMSNQSQWPSLEKSTIGLSSFHSLNSSGGN